MSAPERTSQWRKDFPIEWRADNYISRREFTKFLVMTSGALVAGNGYFVLRKLDQERQTFPAVRIAAISDLVIGAAKLFHYPTENDPAILIRLDETRFAAYKQRCTHLSCPVIFNKTKASLDCPCHNGSFDAASGKVLSGPPPSPLQKIALRVEGVYIHAIGLERHA